MSEHLSDTNVGNIEYIRRDDAVDAFNRIKNTLKNPKTAHYDTLMFYEIEDVLEDVAPADVAPVVHGRWIWKPTKQYCPSDCWYPPLSCEETWNEKDGTWLEDEMYCSECDYNNYHKIKYNFCPNCGAKMDGKE